MKRLGTQATVTTPLQTTCLVFERNGRWTAAVRRMLADSRAVVRRVGSWQLGLDHLAESPDCVAFVELCWDGMADRVRRLAEMIERHRRAAWIVVGDSDLATSQWSVREIGVVDVVLAPSQLNRTRAIIERHARRASPRNSPLVQRVARLLPWPELADKFRIANPAERAAETGPA